MTNKTGGTCLEWGLIGLPESGLDECWGNGLSAGEL